MKQLIVAPAPHAHSGDTVRRNMLLVILALMPAYAVALVEFGWGALITAAISVLACICTEYVISRYVLKEQRQTIGDLSAIVIIGAVVAIGIGKMTFGGLGQNPFNPALVGRVFLLIAYPAQMTTWPTPQGFHGAYVDAETGATPLYYLKHIVKAGDSSVIDQLPSLMDSFLGVMGGSLGEVSAAALLFGGIILICCRVITWHIPVRSALLRCSSEVLSSSAAASSPGTSL